MRSRRLFPFAALAVATLALAGCASSGDNQSGAKASPSSSSSASTDTNTSLCDLPPTPGAFSDAVTVNGPITDEPTITIEGTPEATEIQSTVAVKGEGAKIEDGAYVNIAVTVFDGKTGERLEGMGHGDTASSPQQITLAAAQQNANFQVLGCATEGSRIVAVAPSGDAATAPRVFVFDVLDVVPEADWCAIEATNGVMPTVAFADNGQPTVTIPAGDAPAGVHLEVLKEGDGDVVKPGDMVTVDYMGVKWSDGTSFDSSWSRGEASSFATTGVVVGFKRALEGQKVGSTVVVTMAPSCGYGEKTASASHELAGETLVFVVDIRETAAQ